MPVTDASAVWNGSIGEGSGTMKMSGWEGQYSTPLRFQQEGEGTSPEELVAAAHAGCFSMQLSALLTRGGHVPTSIETSASVDLQKGEDGWAIVGIELTTTADVPGIEADAFAEFANKAKETCPVSKLYAGTTITLNATLK